MKKLILPLLLIALAGSTAYSNKPRQYTHYTGGASYVTLPPGQEFVSDSLFSGEWDTLTFVVKPGAEYFGVFIKPTQYASDATDTLIVKYRSLPSVRWVDASAGSKFHALALTDSTGTTYTVLDWLSGYCYEAYDPDSSRATGGEGLSPIAGRLLQFLLYNGAATGDTTLYEFYLIQLNGQPVQP